MSQKQLIKMRRDVKCIVWQLYSWRTWPLDQFGDLGNWPIIGKFEKALTWSSSSPREVIWPSPFLQKALQIHNRSSSLVFRDRLWLPWKKTIAPLRFNVAVWERRCQHSSKNRSWTEAEVQLSARSVSFKSSSMSGFHVRRFCIGMTLDLRCCNDWPVVLLVYKGAISSRHGIKYRQWRWNWLSKFPCGCMQEYQAMRMLH